MECVLLLGVYRLMSSSRHVHDVRRLLWISMPEFFRSTSGLSEVTRWRGIPSKTKILLNYNLVPILFVDCSAAVYVRASD